MVFRDEVDFHKMSCPHRMIKCVECSQNIETCLMEAHTQRCPKKKILCQNNCGLKIARGKNILIILYYI
jgi:hypothetical protein